MANRENHVCGGTILAGNLGGNDYRYCDRCGAFTYDSAGDLPAGTDREANREAWDESEECSPGAETSGRTEAREELRKKLEGYMSDNIGAAIGYLASAESADGKRAAGMEHMLARNILSRLCGVSV